MNGYLLLCDFAEDHNGKLYINGGGWTRLTMVEPTATFYLAARIEIPWNRANERLPMRLWLQNADGQIVVDDDEKDVRIEGLIEVGRPPGIEHGTDLDTVFTLRMKDMPFEAGRYTWILTVADEEVARVTFTVIKP